MQQRVNLLPTRAATTSHQRLLGLALTMGLVALLCSLYSGWLWYQGKQQLAAIEKLTSDVAERTQDNLVLQQRLQARQADDASQLQQQQLNREIELLDFHWQQLQQQRQSASAQGYWPALQQLLASQQSSLSIERVEFDQTGALELLQGRADSAAEITQFIATLGQLPSFRPLDIGQLKLVSSGSQQRFSLSSKARGSRDQ